MNFKRTVYYFLVKCFDIKEIIVFLWLYTAIQYSIYTLLYAPEEVIKMHILGNVLEVKCTRI